jgi:hypothetical protein
MSKVCGLQLKRFRKQRVIQGLTILCVGGMMFSIQFILRFPDHVPNGHPKGIDQGKYRSVSKPHSSFVRPCLIFANPHRHDTAFAIQCISRFTLAYLLTTRGALAPDAIVLSVYYHWGHSLDDLSVEDLSLKRRLRTQSTTNMYKAQTRRDCTVLDSVNEVRSVCSLSNSFNVPIMYFVPAQELNFRYPQYRYYCLWPGQHSPHLATGWAPDAHFFDQLGLVTGDFSASAFPTYLKVVVWLGSKILAITPEQYANVPVYVS